MRRLLPAVLGALLCVAPLQAGARSFAGRFNGAGLSRGVGPRFPGRFGPDRRLGRGFGETPGDRDGVGGRAGFDRPPGFADHRLGGRLNRRLSPDYVPGPGVEARGSYGATGLGSGTSGVAVAPGLAPDGDPAP